MMGGWKTWVSAIGLILSGIGMIFAGATADPFNFELIIAGWTSVMAGFGAIGIGSKIEKNIIK